MPVSNLYKSISWFGICTCSFECSGSLTTMLLVVVVVAVVVGDLTHSTKIGCRLDFGCLFPCKEGKYFSVSTMFKLSPDKDELGAH